MGENKLKQLKTMLRYWRNTKSVRTAIDICEFLAENLNLENEDES